MTENAPSNQELIQKYLDDTILPDELRQLQQRLTQDASFRSLFLSYVQVDLSIEDTVFFHNCMDAPNSAEVKPPLPEKENEATRTKETNVASRFHLAIQRFLASLFSTSQLL